MNRYAVIVRTYPLITNSLQSGVLMGIGDSISQLYIEKTPINNYNYYRTARFAFMGSAVVVSCYLYI